MVLYCYVEGCNSTQCKSKNREIKTHVPLYGFPKNSELRNQWINALRSLNKQSSALNIPKTAKICIHHFADSCIEQFGFSHVRLKPSSIPSKFPNASRKGMLENISHEETENDLTEMSIQTESSKEIQTANPLPTFEFVDVSASSAIPKEEVEEISTCVVPITLTKTLRYPGDIEREKMKNMTPESTVKAMEILKKAYQTKNKLIKRLQTQLRCQKKKIESLEHLLSELKQHNQNVNICEDHKYSRPSILAVPSSKNRFF